MAKTPEERLDGQKKAILTLRQQMKGLEAEMRKIKTELASLRASVTGTTLTPVDPESPAPSVPSVSGNSYLPVTGPNGAGIIPAWVPSPLCLACGHTKEDGRDKMLTCKSCGKIKADQIKGTHEGAPVKYTSCGHCGKAKGGSLLPVCGKCQRLFQKWRDAA